MKRFSIILLVFLLPATTSLGDTDLGDVDKYFSHTSSGKLPDKNFGNEILYQIFVDRFSNGNSNNDCMHGGRFCSTDRSRPYHYFGGDLRGLINKVPYLKDLGVTRLWLTPIFDNQNLTAMTYRHGQNSEVTSYHGYWFKDWFRLNHFFTDHGTTDYGIVEELIDASWPEMRLLLDTAVNHTAPKETTGWSLDYINNAEPLPEHSTYPREHIGTLLDNGRYITNYSEDLYRTEHEESYTPFFHHFGTITDWNNQFQVENYSLASLADLSQDNWYVRDYMLRAHKFWLDRFPRLAGYRMDTIKHVPMSYWREFDRDLYAAHPNTEIVGEHFGAGSSNSGSFPFYHQTHMSLFDFDFRSTLQNVFLEGGSFSRFVEMWSRDHNLIDAREMVTFVDNHDLPRLRGIGLTHKRMRQALALQMISRGIPCLFYGIEQDLFHPGDPGDPYNRPMMTSFDQNGELFKLTKRLIELRKNNQALRYGSTHVVHETHNILGFERVYGDERVFIALSKNPRQGTDNFPMINLTFPDGEYRDPLSGRSYEVRNGRVNVSLADGDVMILSSNSLSH